MNTKKIVKKISRKTNKKEIWGSIAEKRIAELKELALKNKNVAIFIQTEDKKVTSGTLMIRNYNPSKLLYILMKQIHQENPAMVTNALLNFFRDTK